MLTGQQCHRRSASPSKSIDLSHRRHQNSSQSLPGPRSSNAASAARTHSAGVMSARGGGAKDASGVLRGGQEPDTSPHAAPTANMTLKMPIARKREAGKYKKTKRGRTRSFGHQGCRSPFGPDRLSSAMAHDRSNHASHGQEQQGQRPLC